MKNKQLLCVLFPLLVACTGQRHQQQVSSESIIEEAVRKVEVLKGEFSPRLYRYIDTSCPCRHQAPTPCPALQNGYSPHKWTHPDLPLILI